MITIEQLLESVDLDFEPRFVTKDKNGMVCIFDKKPERYFNKEWLVAAPSEKNNLATYGLIKLSEFDGKDWTECIYEVPRKTTGKIEKVEVGYKDSFKIKDWQDVARTVENKINELVVAVNKHADIIKQIGDWGTSKGECLWCETLTKFEPNELKETNNG